MKITALLSDDAVLREVGERLARIRLEKNLTQAGLAGQAGVSKRTVERLESGEVAVQLSGLVRVCRVLDLIGRFDIFLPEPVPSPVAQLKMRGKVRRRASGSRKAADRVADEPWTWGEKS